MNSRLTSLTIENMGGSITMLSIAFVLIGIVVFQEDSEITKLAK
jgi:hypothetical protein